MNGLELFTAFHVLISLIGILSGFVAVFGMVRSKPLDWWTDSLPHHDGGDECHRFPVSVSRVHAGDWHRHHLDDRAGAGDRCPAGQTSERLLAADICEQRGRGAVLQLLRLIVQSFQRVPVLKALAPTQTEAPFAIAQLAALVGFVVLGYVAARGFLRAAPRAAVVRGSHA